MATEIERKFLVSGEFLGLAVKNHLITQYYISVDPDKIIRIRIIEDNAFLTIKSRIMSGSFGRNEWEFSIPVSEAKELVNICLPGKVIKTRYYVPSESHTFEVDVFHDKNEGLVIAEIELNSEDEKFVKPAWLGDEITGLSEYYNSNLIK